MYITQTRAAEIARVHVTTIQRRIKDGSLRLYAVGQKRLLNDQEVIAAFSAAGDIVKPGPCRIIAVCNQKGGVGKTTTCANLAATLANQGLRVLVVDDDPQGNLTHSLGADPDKLDRSLYSVLVEKLPIQSAIINPVMSIKELALVGSNLELAGAELTLVNAVARESLLRNAIAPILDDYDYIFIDSPPALGILTLNALTAATEVIIPVDMGVFSLRGVSKLLDTIAEVKKINPGLHSVRPLANLVTTTNLSSDVIGSIQASFPSALFATRVRRSVRVGEAQAVHMPICVYKPNDPSSRDYVALAEEVKAGA